MSLAGSLRACPYASEHTRSRGVDRVRAMCGSVPTRRATACFNENLSKPTEIHMYIGIGTILVIALIVYLLRRA